MWNEKELFKDLKKDWIPFFNIVQEKEYFKILLQNLEKEYKTYVCYPQINNIFRIFKIISLSQIKVILFGQDPYHNKEQANGIAFSVNSNEKLPPSLKNIFKELKNDLNIIKNSGNLLSWVENGIFLYNPILTVREHEPNTHSKIGWKEFTIELIKYIENNSKRKIIFILWGKKAQKYQSIINSKYIIMSAHPSPFSYKYFVNSKPFSKTNELLRLINEEPIDWK